MYLDIPNDEITKIVSKVLTLSREYSEEEKMNLNIMNLMLKRIKKWIWWWIRRRKTKKKEKKKDESDDEKPKKRKIKKMKSDEEENSEEEKDEKKKNKWIQRKQIKISFK